jgi:predicted MFS family arabinose efflux permease
VLGAIAGGAIVLGLGYATAFLANAVALALFTVLIIAARSLQPACDLLQAQVRDAVPHAVRQYLRPGVVRVVIASTTIFFLLVGPLSRQMPSIAAQHGDDPMYIGYLVGALALGAAIASPVVFRFSGSHYRHPILGTALVAAGPLLVLLALSRSLVLDLVVMVLIGIAGELVRKSAEFSLTREISMGSATLAGPLVTSLGAIGIAVGALVVGECFDALGLEPSLMLFGAAVVGCGVAFVWQDRVRVEVPFPGR